MFKPLAYAALLCLSVATAAHAHGDHAASSPKTYSPEVYFKGLRGDYTEPTPRWWKGNTHTHTWWSDGDSPPENAAAWYREHGYQFVVLSDHNRMQENTIARGQFALFHSQWYPIEDEPRAQALAIYQKHFGDDWVQTRKNDQGITEVKLKALDEFRHLFEAPGEFIFVKGEEITDRFGAHPFHMNAVNIQDVIVPRSGKTPAEVLQNNLNAVLAQPQASLFNGVTVGNAKQGDGVVIGTHGHIVHACTCSLWG